MGLGRAGRRMSEIYRFAGLELDTSRFQVRRGGEVLPVQPQVFDVLHYLVANHDRIVSKDELLAKVWNRRVVSEATLSSRIKAVRQLIGDTGKEQRLLLTMRHRGFRYVGPVEAELPDARQIASAVTMMPRTASAPASGQATTTTTNPPTSIAVLPFEVLGGKGTSERHAHVGQGIAADIIGLLSRHQWLTVIARGSSFAVDPRLTPRQVGAVLGVGYLLTGRTRWGESGGRIDAELVDCDTGRLLWHHDYVVEDVRVESVLEDIALRIAATIEPKLEQLERFKTDRKRPEEFQAWDCCHRAFWHLYHFTPDDLAIAKTWFEKALAFDPNLARAHAGLAYAWLQLAFYGEPSQRPDALNQALAHSQAAVALEPHDAFNRFALGRSLCLSCRYPEAEAELLQAIEANRSFAQAYFALAFCYTVWDKPAEALPLYERAVRLSPQDPHLWTFHHMRSVTLYRLNRLEEAEDFVRAAVRQQYATYWPFATLCALLAELARIEEARAVGDRLRQMKPGYSLAFARQDFFFIRAPEFVERYLRQLAAAGIPEC
jgi:DNA-binding winged helix-turn-helix (wHTH) protein/Tfp pilus assembly protein PilF